MIRSILIIAVSAFVGAAIGFTLMGIAIARDPSPEIICETVSFT